MQKASIETNHAVIEDRVQIGCRGRCGGLRKPDRALSGHLCAAKSRICAHHSVNFGLRMANTEGIEAFCVGLADLTCCVARRWLLSAVRRVHERKFPAHVDRRSVRCRHVCRIRCATLWCLQAFTRWRRAMRTFATNFRKPQQVTCKG